MAFQKISTIRNEYVDGLMHDSSNSIANALELLESCTKPPICAACYISHTGTAWQQDSLSVIDTVIFITWYTDIVHDCNSFRCNSLLMYFTLICFKELKNSFAILGWRSLFKSYLVKKQWPATPTFSIPWLLMAKRHRNSWNQQSRY